MPCAATGGWLALHPQELRHGASRCLDPPRLGAQNSLGACLAKLWASGSHIIGTSRAMVHSAAGLKKCPHFRQSMLRAPVSHTIGTNWAMVRADASTSLGTCLAGPGSWLAHHRQQLVPWIAQMPRPASAHSLRCCGMLARTPSAPATPWCAQIPRPASAHALAAAIRNLAYHRHHLVLGAPDASAHAWLG